MPSRQGRPAAGDVVDVYVPCYRCVLQGALVKAVECADGAFDQVLVEWSCPGLERSLLFWTSAHLVRPAQEAPPF